jgi:hypothetical protein
LVRPDLIRPGNSTPISVGTELLIPAGTKAPFFVEQNRLWQFLRLADQGMRSDWNPPTEAPRRCDLQGRAVLSARGLSPLAKAASGKPTQDRVLVNTTRSNIKHNPN